MITNDDDADRYRIAYDQAQRGIDIQAEHLELVRGRAGTLFTASAVAGALLGRLVYDRPPPGPTQTSLSLLSGWGVIALVIAAAAFVGICVLTVVIWWPTEVVYRLAPATIVAGYIESKPRRDLGNIYRDLALHMGRHAKANTGPLNLRQRLFAIGCVLFVAEVIMLGLALWDVAA